MIFFGVIVHPSEEYHAENKNAIEDIKAIMRPLAHGIHESTKHVDTQIECKFVHHLHERLGFGKTFVLFHPCV